MSSPEIDRLIVDSIVDLDRAKGRIGELESRIWTAQMSLFEAWAKKAVWAGELDNAGTLQVWPKEWAKGAKDAIAWFEIDYAPSVVEGSGDGLNLDLTRLVGAGGGQLCLWFRHGGGRNKWKPVARQLAHTVTSFDFAMTQYGNFYTDCTPETARMAEALENGDPSPALKPIEDALDRARRAQGAFTEMLRQAGEL